MVYTENIGVSHSSTLNHLKIMATFVAMWIQLQIVILREVN